MKKILEILATYDTQPVEILNSLVMIWLGSVLLYPDATFNSVNLTYVVMSKIAPETLWGLGLIGVGAMSILAIARNIWILRIIASALKMASLFTLGILLFLANPLTTGSSYIALGLGAGWCFVRITSLKRIE